MAAIGSLNCGILTRILAAGCLLTGGCTSYPQDATGTMDRVAASHAVRIGIVDGDGDGPAGGRIAGKTFVSALERRTGARAIMSAGSAERLFDELQTGRIDVVIGRFADGSPWRSEVALIEPFARGQEDGDAPVLRAVARNGENRWVMLLEAVTRDGGGGS